MCGRYKLACDGQMIMEAFGLKAVPPWSARYNIAPTQQAPVVRVDGRGERECARLRWGLVPSWAKDLSIGSRMINARAETVAEKPAFRHALRRQRCLVPADGFYEWRREGRHAQPFRIGLRDGGLFAFAGLWERWQGEGAPPVETFTILTTAPNEILASLHDRMPVILDRAAHERWLDPAATWQGDLQPVLVPYPAERMAAVPVGTLVNSPMVDDPRCAEPVG
jgi:putative SOS response-associated peptidase YedK